MTTEITWPPTQPIGDPIDVTASPPTLTVSDTQRRFVLATFSTPPGTRSVGIRGSLSIENVSGYGSSKVWLGIVPHDAPVNPVSPHVAYFRYYNGLVDDNIVFAQPAWDANEWDMVLVFWGEGLGWPDWSMYVGDAAVGIALSVQPYDNALMGMGAMKCCEDCGQATTDGSPASFYYLLNARGSTATAFWTPLEWEHALGPPASAHYTFAQIPTPIGPYSYNPDQPADSRYFYGMTLGDLAALGTIPVAVELVFTAHNEIGKGPVITYDQNGWNLGRIEWDRPDFDAFDDGPDPRLPWVFWGVIDLPTVGNPLCFRAVCWDKDGNEFGSKAFTALWRMDAQYLVQPVLDEDGAQIGGNVTDIPSTLMVRCRASFMLQTRDEVVGTVRIREWEK